MNRLPLLIVLLAAVFAPTAGADGRDDPAYWQAPRAELAAMGEGLIAWETNREGSWRIYAVPLSGGEPYPLSGKQPDRDHVAAHLSPDGKHLTYLSMPRGVSGYKAIKKNVTIPLHVVDIETGEDRVAIDNARPSTGGHRSVTWIDKDRFYFVGGDGKAREHNLATGKTSEPILTNGDQHLPNPTGKFACERHHFHPMDLQKRELRKTGPRLGGCEPYFTQDGKWGIRMNGAGGPVTRIDLASGQAVDLLQKNDPRLPDGRGYVYFPMPSPCQRLLAYAASPNQHDHFKSDYEIFLVPIDPDTLHLTGRPVRITFDEHTDRYPTVWLGDLDLKEHRGEAPFAVRFEHPQIKRPDDWRWDYGEQQREETPARHRYTEPGIYTVTATRGEQTLRGRVVVQPAAPPKVLATFLTEPRKLHIVFDEPIDATQTKLQLGSRTSVDKLVADDQTLIAHLAGEPANPDVVHLSGVRDRSQSRYEMAAAELSFSRAAWPVVRDGLVFVFDTADAANRVGEGEAGRSITLQPRGRSQLDRHHAMIVDNGAYVADTATAAELLKRLQASNALTIEALITTHSGKQSGPARIVSFSKDAGSRNFTLGQEGANLVLRLRTPRTGGNGTKPSATLMPITPGQPTHVIVTYADGKLTVYRNGEQAAVINSIAGDFSNWDRHTLIFGDEANGGRNWNGTIEGIAIYDRPLTAEQVQQHWQAVRAKQAARPDITPTQIKAKLVAASEAPTLKQIAPYREALIVHEYQVLEHLAGPQPNAQRIRVVDWAMLDGDKQRGAKPGGKPTAMTVEPFDAQPQLKSLYMADTLELDIETPMYYRVDR